MINYSFIIPHKNSPELLKKCINSIPRRKDVQIIVVDDNSDDDKVDFEHFPGMDDPSVEVYLTKEGKGAGYARNVGLEHAVGKWLIFADADDYFTNEITDALDKCKGLEADIIFLKNKAIRIPSGEISNRGFELNRRVDIAIETGDYSLAILYSSPWQKFFKRSLIIDNHIFFNEVRWGNDVVFMGRIAAVAKSFEAFDEITYCITESDNSIIKDKSLESRVVRFFQEGENVSILKSTQYRNEPSVYYWHFMTWFDVWKKDKVKAISLLPNAVKTSGLQFIKCAFKVKFGK